ncbi:MAG: UDP-N-acetylmuramoyl-L-alanyl-D-glutamate--2,6-diaminopimelate ligase [Anaerolineae bacterium]|nr:UDP-N-acetylmuramoyl-L-alanyl-D-glutamate--2,6-diaminopimelate ligase [Anaerolineae bacterium]
MNEEVHGLKRLLDIWAKAVAGTSLPQPPLYNGPDARFHRMVEHSGDVEPGAAFVARVRPTGDGHPYIAHAVSRGATLVIGQRPAPDELGVPYLQVEDSAVAAAWLAAAAAGFPGRELLVIGVTGTDGKTTTANLIFSILQAAGIRTGLLSTIRAVIGEVEEPLALHVTTPEAPVVQRYLRRMVDAGLTHVVVEATSHGLAQHRVDAIDYNVAVVTNITHEHLDYHSSYEAYYAAKERLFRMLAAEWPRDGGRPRKERQPRTAVLNRDDESYARLAAIPIAQQRTYGLLGPADVSAREIVYGAAATHFQLALPGQELPVAAHLVGDFNVYNMLAAAATATALAIPAPAVKRGLESVEQLSGRMERIDEGQPFLVIVDFAHTPNALGRAIEAARRMITPAGRVITVFGSAGLRDVAKRRMMAGLSARNADLTVLTAEDPRTESLASILEMMAAACRDAGSVENETFWRIADRGQAIYHALALAEPQDVVVICGKGHEQSMAFGTTEYPWDDREASRVALRHLMAGEPMPDLGLPTYGA